MIQGQGGLSLMRIGEFAKACDVSTDTLRFYERRGLLPQAGRRANGYRDYGREDVARLRLIRVAKMLGFSLGEIRKLIDRVESGNVTREEVELQLRDKIDSVDAHIGQLRDLRASLLDLQARLTCAPGTALGLNALAPDRP
jgi:MerR family Zn(II)-responsive transcriptional regulator of zntA